MLWPKDLVKAGHTQRPRGSFSAIVLCGWRVLGLGGAPQVLQGAPRPCGTETSALKKCIRSQWDI